MQSFLILKTSAIGDVVQTFPVLEFLRAKFPTARIDWMVEKGVASLLHSHPLIDQVVQVDTKKWRKGLKEKQTWSEILTLRKAMRNRPYDVVFDLQGNIKSGLLSLLIPAREKVGFGFYSVREKPNILFTSKRFNFDKKLSTRKKYIKLIESYFQEKESSSPQIGQRLRLNEQDSKRLKELTSKIKNQSRFVIMVAFGSKWKNKQLKEETLVSCLKKIEQTLSPLFLFIFGGQEEKILADHFAQQFQESGMICGDMSLPLWQNLMYEVDLVFTVDSAALHLCAMTTTPSFSVFGPTKAEIFKPLGHYHQTFQGTCPYSKVFVNHCSKLRTCKTGSCIKDISAEDLYQAFMKWHCVLKERKEVES